MSYNSTKVGTQLRIRISLQVDNGYHHIVEYVQLLEKKVLVNISYCGILFLWLLQ